MADRKSTGGPTSARPGPSWRRSLDSPALVCLVLALATAALFSRTVWFDFVNYDDPDYVSSNAHVLTGLTLDNIRWAFVTGHASNWHPLTWLSHMLDATLFGEGPQGPHLVNVALHVLNTLLVFLVLRQMTGAHWRSAAVAALFAWHPLHVESVAWISERKDVLSTFFLLLTLGAYSRFAGWPNELRNAKPKPPAKSKRQIPKKEPGEATDRPAAQDRWRFYWLALVFFALGLMSKPMLVTLPFLLLLLDYWPFRRIDFFPSRLPASILLEKAPFFVLSIASCVTTFLVQRHGGAVSTSLSLGGRLANALISYARYLGKTFWPQKLSVLYPHPGQWPLWAVAGAALLLLALTVAAIALGRNRRYVVVGWLWFLGLMVPVIGLIQVGIQSMADRYTYVPLLGVFLVLVWGIAEAAERWSWRPAILAGIGGAVLAVCAVLTVRQAGIWRNSEQLFLHAVQATEKNYLAYNNLGFFLSREGRPLEALDYYRKSLEINPAYEDALNNMGYALAGQRKFSEAVGFYEQALRIRPKHVEVHNNLGNALSELGRGSEAIEHYRIGLAENPEHADAHNNLGIALAMQGNLEAAVDHFRSAIRFKRNYASAHSNLGNALAAQRKFDEALVQYQDALRLNPKDPQAHNNVANVLVEKGQIDQAVDHYREALRFNPDNPEAHLNLGLALTRQGKTQEAISHYTEALRLKPDYAAAREQLAKASQAGAPR